ncbi:hypothetical protein [Psychroflexus tropicus]|uniref:hypothetical protein n=1 Tax=Psychroflexus tropicus TaxID=197345 RepID=UPI0003A559A1|nr:hypothetical protein [Psychroflexus tropicus]
MKKKNNLHRTIAIFLLFIFMPSVFPINQMFANGNGPGSPEAAGFEPVDATDMVNLTNGNLSYVLPLLDVEGFPVNLSYHAGITSDMDASWVGLGWYLNPGAINRSVNNTPDDWKAGLGIDFNSFNSVEDYYSVTASVGFDGVTSVGVGMNWGGGQGLSGSVNASLGLNSELLKSVGVNAGVNASASTTGNVSVGASLAYQNGSMSAGASYSYSMTEQRGSLGVGVGFADEESSGVSGFEDVSYGLGANFSGGGSFSVGAGANLEGSKGSVSNGVGMGSSSFSMGDASVDVQNTAVALPLHFVGIPVTLGFSKTRVKINIRKGFNNVEWGSLYSKDFYTTISDNNPLIENSGINFNGHQSNFNDYVERTKSLDTYSTKLPQPEEEFISDYSKDIENVNFTSMGFDDYNVAAQGIMGNMRPYFFKNANIFGKGQKTTNEEGDPIHIFWHHGSMNSSFDRELGNNFNFSFEGQFTSNEIDNPANLSINNNAFRIDQIINNSSHQGFAQNTNDYRGKSPNYVEVFTNNEIANNLKNGLITPRNIPDSDRGDPLKFDPDGIGAYKITSPDGKTYHFSIPVYHYERVSRNQIDEIETTDFDITNVSEKRQYSRYATHWLLTAITGPDYVDANLNDQFDKDDFGYWVELEYGKWSDGYVWRAPYKDFTYNYNTDTTDDVGAKDKGGYSFGRKQTYYLDKINTKNKTALFVKDVRYDALGKDLKYKFSNNGQINLGSTIEDGDVLNYTDGKVDVLEDEVEYKKEYSLKLNKIILLESEVGRDLPKDVNYPTPEASIYDHVTNQTHSPKWRSKDFEDEFSVNYFYEIHNEKDILDESDIPPNFEANHALKVIEFDYNYDLAQNSDSSKDAPAGSPNDNKYGKLTLNSIETKGRAGISYMPKTYFDYHMKGFNNISLPELSPNGVPPSNDEIKDYLKDKNDYVDNWGFIQNQPNTSENEAKAWSLKSIQTPTGARIDIEYEEDDYWIEAFSRRYWEKHLSLMVNREGVNNQGENIFKVRFKNNLEVDSSNHVEDFNDYFEIGQRVFLDLYLCQMFDDWGSDNERGAVDIREDDIVTVEDIYTELNSNGISEQILLLDVRDTGAFPLNEYNTQGVYGDPRPHIALNRYYYDDFHPRNDDHLEREQCPTNNNEHRYNLVFKLLANKVPEDETGGGLRVSEIRTTNPIDNTTYKVNYDYTNPFTGKSSGITSYSPVNGLKYVPYQSEVPPPGVMYEYVTMTEKDINNNYEMQTRYRHHVLKPVFNIFNPNIFMEAQDANSVGEDNIFWANVEDDYDTYDGTINSNKIKAKKIEVNINNALLGQIKSIETFNKEGQVVNKISNEYINGRILTGENLGRDGVNYGEPNKGIVKESFNSMKTIFKSNDNGNIIYDRHSLLSTSSKTEYNNMLKKTTVSNGMNISSVEYFDVDPWLGSFRKSVSKTSQNDEIIAYKIPAYEKYSEMGSKILNGNNKNMLTQQAMSITKFKNLNSSTGITLNASISTWNKSWNYIENDGTSSNDNDIHRRQKNYVWKDELRTDDLNTGTYQTNVDEVNSYFDWSTNTPTSDKWQLASEVTQYSRSSIPLEVKDINGNFASTKLTDESNKILVNSNSRYTEMYYSGAEYVDSGNIFEGGVKGANFRTDEVAHTGKYSVKPNNVNDAVFEISGAIGSDENDLSHDFRPGTYKVSFWTLSPFTSGNINGTTLKLNNQEIKHSEIVKARCWSMYNYYIDLEPNSNFNLQVTNTSGSNFYFDDFRLHPVSSSMMSYVYDAETDDLTYILDNNNMGSAFRYDKVGRLKTTYTEVENTDQFWGGFKITEQFKMHYQNKNDINIDFNEDINDCLYLGPITNNSIEFNVDVNHVLNPYKLKFKAIPSNNSSSLTYEWRWLSDNQNNFTPWVEGSSEQEVPYTINYCTDDYFEKAWDAEVRITDLSTNDVITKQKSYEEPFSNCDYLINDNISIGVEARLDVNACSNDYRFSLYPLDPNTSSFGSTGYIDNNLGQTFSQDIGEEFCNTVTYVASTDCQSGYVKYVSLSPFHENSSNYTYEFYLDCASEDEVLNNTHLIDETHSSKYAKQGLVVFKVDGKINSVKSNNRN